jgi:hypothetical protein
MEHESRIAAHLGNFWYALYLSGHKLACPFSNLKRSIRKRLVRWRIIVGSPQAPQAALRVAPVNSSEMRPAAETSESVAPAVTRKNTASVADADAANLLSV